MKKLFFISIAQVLTLSAYSVEFRPLVLEDFDRGFMETLAALKPIDIPRDKIVEVFHERLAQGALTYVLEEEGRVIATATMFLETKFYRKARKVAHIEDVAVHPDYHRRGFGTLIMQGISAEAKARDCYKMILDCNPKNINFYESNGYQQCEVQMRLDFLEE